MAPSQEHIHFQVVAHALQQCIVLTQYYVLLFHPIQPGTIEAKNLFMQWQAGRLFSVVIFILSVVQFS